MWLAVSLGAISCAEERPGGAGAPGQEDRAPAAEQAAGDPVEVAPGNYRVLLDNEHVRVLELRARPGERSEMVTHRWPYVVYDLTGGSMRFTSPEGETSTDEGREPGEVTWEEPKTHAWANVGDAEARALIVQVKAAD